MTDQSANEIFGQNAEIVTMIKNHKITVVGDSWQQLLILPEDTPERTKRECKIFAAKCGASRMVELIHAALAANGSIGHWYVPSPNDEQLLATAKLEEYELENDDFENLRHLGFPENLIPEKPLRIERSLGVSPLSDRKIDDSGITVTECNSCTVKETCDQAQKYLVIYDDCLYTKELKGYKEKDSDFLEKLKECFKNDTLETIKYILWHPRRFGDASLKSSNRVLSAISASDKDEVKLRTIVFLRADDLADAGIGPRGDSSIEECLEGILNAFKNRNELKDLIGCKAIVIENGVDCAFLITWSENDATHCQTFFRTNRTENAYRQSEGYFQGLGSFMVTSCLKALIETEVKAGEDVAITDRLSAGIKDGLWRMLVKFCIGYVPPEKDVTSGSGYLKSIDHIYKLPSLDKITEQPKCWLEKCVKIAKRHHVHVEKLCNATKTSVTYMSHFFQHPGQQLEFLPTWLLEQQWDALKTEGKRDKFLYDIVRRGLKKQEEDGEINFPVARFGDMEVVEPDEISMFRRLNTLMRKYLDSDEKTPLGLAVFGAPGSGKSYGIKQVAKAVAKDDTKLIECNLAQLKKPEELYQKFLEARNYNTESPSEKQLPILFLDEFDAKYDEVAFGWCKYLLSVLQDGVFRLDGVLYETGKVLVVCAGGLCHSFREFEARSSSDQSIDAKVPDLIGRFRGYVDIAGPNPYFPYPVDDKTLGKLKILNENTRVSGSKPLIDPHWIEATKEAIEKSKHSENQPSRKNKMTIPVDIREVLDPLYKIRRAVLLRNRLQDKMPFIYNDDTKELQIGTKVLRAMLNIDEYKYGARSMQAIIEMSVAICRESRRFTSAMLPPPEQLDMHVDAEKFYKIIDEA